MSPAQKINEEADFRILQDIGKITSSGSLKIFTGKYVDLLQEFIQKDSIKYVDNSNIIKAKSILHKNFGQSLTEPLLGKHFKIEAAVGKLLEIPVLDSSLPYIPVWEHLHIIDPVDIQRPSTPTVLKRTSNLESNMNYYYNDSGDT